MKNLPFRKRFGFAVNGIWSALKSETSFRTQMLAAVAVLFVLIVLGASPLWWALIVLTISLVLMAELFNTALEHALDRLHPQVHESIRLAKDCAAGAVLVASFASLAVFAAYLVATLHS